MTLPTVAIAASLLADYRTVNIERHGVAEDELYTEADIKACLGRATGLALHQTLRLPPPAGAPPGMPELELTPYYAGHCLGAAMFHIRAGQQSVRWPPAGRWPSVASRLPRAFLSTTLPVPGRSCTLEISTRLRTASSGRRLSRGSGRLC